MTDLTPKVKLSTIVREWGRIGVTGFGGPPAHIVLFRRLCVEERNWLSAREFEDAIVATNLLPGPASTQLAIFCAWRVRGRLGGLIGGVCFILPGLALILVLSVLFLAAHPPLWVLGAAGGAGACVPAVALTAALRLVEPGWRHVHERKAARIRWLIFILIGAVAAATLGAYLVVILVLGGLTELIILGGTNEKPITPSLAVLPVSVATAAVGGIAALSWVALKVGALSYGGGFVIIPLMQRDVVVTYHWMTGVQFLSAVALGQVTPGPVVQTVAVVGYAAAGIGGALLAALIAFAPSFCFVLGGASHFDRLRASERTQAFFRGAGAVVIGAIGGSALPLARELTHEWQFAILGLAVIWLVVMRRGIVTALISAGALGVIAVAAGAPH
jgi:chromate transporter